MVKTIMIVRFGAAHPTDIERQLMDQIVDKQSNPCAVYTSIHGGTISIIKTELDVEKLTERYDKISEEFDTPLPIIVLEVGAEGTSMSLDAYPQMKKLFAMFQDTNKPVSVVKKVCELTLDQLLDLVSKVGVKNLSDKELSRLNELSGK